MGVFDGQPLRIMGRLLNFKAGAASAPVELDADGIIQPVVDVSRWLELRALNDGRNGGYFVTTPTNTHAGADTQQTTLDPYVIAAAVFGIPTNQITTNFDIWWLRAQLQGNNNVLTSSTFSADSSTTVFGATAPFSFVLAEFAGGLTSVVPGTRPRAAGGSLVGNFFIPAPFPFSQLCSSALFTSISSGAGDLQMNCLWWMGARGARPPTVA